MARFSRLAATFGVAAGLLSTALLPSRGQDGGRPAAPEPAERKEVKAVAPVKVEVRERIIAKGAVELRAVAPAMAGRVVEPVIGDQDPQVQNYLQMLRPTLRAELYLVRSICRPDPEQLGPIAEAAERGFLEAVKQYVKQERAPRVAGAPRVQANLDRLVAEGLVAALKERLSPEQADRYEAEVARRVEEQRDAAARNLVSLFDRELVLSADQRDRMVEDLVAHWDDAWCPSLEHFQYGLRFLPRLPDDRVEPILNAEQKAVWKDLQARPQSFVSFLGNQLDNHELEEKGKDADGPARAGVK